MKIGHFVSFGLGGADKNALNIVAGLKKLGADITVFYNDFSEPKIMPVHNKGYVPVSRKQQFQALCEIKKINTYADLHNENLDLLHTHRSGEDLWLIPGFDRSKHPFKIIETNFHGNKLTQADVRAYPNNTLCSVKKITLNKENIVIPNAIDAPASDLNLRYEMELQGKVVFGRLARPDSDIYTSLNLEAYSKIETSNTVFVYVAPHENAKRDAQKLGIKNIVWVDPELDPVKLSKLYNTFDVFLHSNCVGETFGNTIAEAMMHGLPVVSHTAGTSWPQAHKELFLGNDNFIVSGPDVNQYTQKVSELLASDNLRKKTGGSMQERIKSTCSSEIVANKYLIAYESILGEK